MSVKIGEAKYLQGHDPGRHKRKPGVPQAPCRVHYSQALSHEPCKSLASFWMEHPTDENDLLFKLFSYVMVTTLTSSLLLRKVNGELSWRPFG